VLPSSPLSPFALYVDVAAIVFVLVCKWIWLRRESDRGVVDWKCALVVKCTDDGTGCGNLRNLSAMYQLQNEEVAIARKHI